MPLIIRLVLASLNMDRLPAFGSRQEKELEDRILLHYSGVQIGQGNTFFSCSWVELNEKGSKRQEAKQLEEAFSLFIPPTS